ncbi:hypothetical protein E2C01_018443 [Portunus trituberculatus]|uniref:Uncharacterized protein n=1 Tax=Portunus trituberculatus TaxID=210409 RepID=A0A5B7DW58_PORTR|nr:hypothetical protein [Portunus trituberculatus]
MDIKPSQLCSTSLGKVLVIWSGCPLFRVSQASVIPPLLASYRAGLSPLTRQCTLATSVHLEENFVGSSTMGCSPLQYLKV